MFIIRNLTLYNKITKTKMKNKLVQDKKTFTDFFNLKDNLKDKINDKESLVSSGIIFMFGSMAVAFFNYLYHLFMGRMLGPAEYGILGSLFALIYIATFSTTAFNLSVSKFSAEFHGSNKLGSFKLLIRKSLMYVTLFGAILLGIYFALIPVIAEFMNLEEYTGLIIVGLIAFISIISAVLIGALNGMQKFVWQNSSNFAATFLKFIIAVGLVYLGFGVGGALIAILIGLVISILISVYPFLKSFKNVKVEAFDSKKVPRYFVFVFLASILPILIITIDQILVKHYLSSQAGYYVAAGTIAKIIWFATGFLVGPLFPKVVSMHSQGKDSSKLLFKALVYTSFLVGVGCLAYFIMPTFIVSLLYGQAYLEIVPLIGIFAVAMGLFSLIQIMVVYNLAIERKSFLWILILGLLMEISGIFVFHNSLLDIIKIIFATNCFVLISLLFYNRREIFNLK